MNRQRKKHLRWWHILVEWLDSHAPLKDSPAGAEDRIVWLRTVPFVVLHLMCLGVIWVGFSWPAFGTAVMLYFIRMFFVTGFYHRYFSHRTFKTSRAFQLVMAICGGLTLQRGPLWWAAHHRHHHAHSDKPEDAHSPRLRGMFWSHLGWFLSRKNSQTPLKMVKDWTKFPELVFLDRFDWILPGLLAIFLYLSGTLMAWYVPQWETTGMQMLIWGFFISTVVLFHATFLINSLSHLIGTQRFKTSDDSRNSFILALITLGEGWHNNHHHCPGAVRQGLCWWEVDLTYYLLWLLSKFNLIWDLRPVPAPVMQFVRTQPHDWKRGRGSREN